MMFFHVVEIKMDNCNFFNIFISFINRGLGDEKSRIKFTHVHSLAGLKVNNICSGGNHSWAIVDEN